MNTADAQKAYDVAYAIAEKAHAGQFRKAPDNRPYFEHCKDVAAMMPTRELKTVALLHDVIEDTKVTAEDLLAAGIPQVIVDAVSAMTKPDGTEDYLGYVKSHVLPNELARKVKLADNYVNMRDRLAAVIAGGPDAEHAKKKVAEYVGSIQVLIG